MWANEMPPPSAEDAQKVKEEDFRHYDLSNGYQNR
jgi:hypothetical protein